jgi:hypothetical protein
MEVKWRFVVYLVTVRKMAKKFFSSSDLHHRATDLLEKEVLYKRVNKEFPTIGTYWVLKDAEFDE